MKSYLLPFPFTFFLIHPSSSFFLLPYSSFLPFFKKLNPGIPHQGDQSAWGWMRERVAGIFLTKTRDE